MKLRRVIGLGLAGVAATAGVNRALRTRAGDLEPALSGEHRTFRWRGIDVAYTEAGDPDAPDLVLFHGTNAAASSGEFREIFDALASEYHVVAPDLPGFGVSDRPRLKYSHVTYEDFVADFLGEFDEPAVLASSLAGAYAAAAAREVEISRLLLVSPTATAMPWRREWLRELLRSPVLGTALFNLQVSRPALRYFNLDHGYYDPDSLSEDWLDYQWRSAHQPNAKFAPASFLAGFLNSDLELATTLADLDAPVTLLWGRETDTTPVEDGRELAEQADAGLVVFEAAMLLPHVEHPELFVETVRDVVPGASDAE